MQEAAQGEVVTNEVYARIPQMKRCWRRCWRYCREPRVTAQEHAAMEKASGKPFIAVKPQPEGDLLIQRGEENYCPMLVRTSCTVYEVRPAICRLWGTHWTMKCPYGCEPERWLSDDELLAIMRAIREAQVS